MILNLSLLLIIFILLTVLSMIWPPDSPWSPWWRTSDETIRKTLKLAKVSSKDIVYDLGSGDGRTLIIAAKEFGTRAIGIEIDPLRFFISAVMIYINTVTDRVSVRRENFLKSDFSDASVIFVYLVPKALERLIPKFKKLKKGTRIVSIKYEVNLPVVQTIDQGKYKIYLYKI